MTQYLVHEERYKGFRIQIEYDQCAESPREWSCLGKLVLFHDRFNLPNESNMTKEEAINFYQTYNTEEWILLPVNMYEHGSVALSTSNSYPFNCRWDSSHIGFIYIHLDDVRQEYGEDYDRNQIEKYLHNEVVQYGQYVNGEVYYWDVSKIVTCDNCMNEEFKPLEGGGNYIGDWDYALAEAKSTIDAEA